MRRTPSVSEYGISGMAQPSCGFGSCPSTTAVDEPVYDPSIDPTPRKSHIQAVLAEHLVLIWRLMGTAIP